MRVLRTLSSLARKLHGHLLPAADGAVDSSPQHHSLNLLFRQFFTCTHARQLFPQKPLSHPPIPMSHWCAHLHHLGSGRHHFVLGGGGGGSSTGGVGGLWPRPFCSLRVRWPIMRRRRWGLCA